MKVARVLRDEVTFDLPNRAVKIGSVDRGTYEITLVSSEAKKLLWELKRVLEVEE